MKRLAIALALLVGGCGFGAGEETGEVHVAVTRDFGAAPVGEQRPEALRESDTVMRALERSHDVETQFGGNFVQSLDGITGGSGKDWFFFVNGMEATKGAADITPRDGDRVWWDHHAWGEDTRIPAVVGSFPQPFASHAARVECASTPAICDSVRKQLTAAGARLVESGRAVRVLVGEWGALNGDFPRDGLFVRDEAGDLELLDGRGDPRQLLEAGGGLVAATAESGQLPIWLVTGIDERGVTAAAAALTEQRVANHFALAVTPTGDIALPVR